MKHQDCSENTKTFITYVLCMKNIFDKQKKVFATNQAFKKLELGFLCFNKIFF